ncbi:MAG TPA: ABC transporter transmembrane domain-containing protein, partial [Puia sp.]|nr:ABC transporter transmembrane domain-containing protein [Puia sp.]
MKHLKAVNKYFWKYRWRFLLGLVFIILSNYFRILAPQITGYVVNSVDQELRALPAKKAQSPGDGAAFTPVTAENNDGGGARGNGTAAGRENSAAVSANTRDTANYDILVRKFIRKLDVRGSSFKYKVVACGVTLLVLALISGFFLFLTRQTIIVMSRHIEYDQKKEIYDHYQQLDTNFYKTHSTGDLMSRMAEDVSRVRMYTGPATMYLANLLVTIGFSLFFMFRKDALLSIYVLTPLPILAVTIYYVNTIIHKRSEHIQALLSSLTTNAQESYSGIRVIKSFVQEAAMLRFFSHNGEEYRKNAVNLAKVESIYFPSMGLMIGLSTLLAIMIGGIYVIYGRHGTDLGTITEFVIYITLLTFPVSAIGWVASMVQRASASQKRLNEFLDTVPAIQSPAAAVRNTLEGNISFQDVNFTYPNTGIRALAGFNLDIHKGEKVVIIGRTGSGKTTIAQLLLRMYDPDSGKILIDGTDLRRYDLQDLRRQISYVPQDVFLFSDTVSGNIQFGLENPDEEKVRMAARYASVD